MTSVNVIHPYFNTTLTVVPTTTVLELKNMLNVSLRSRQEDLTDYKVKFVFGNGTELMPFVFDRDEYDQVNCQMYVTVLPGSRIELSTRPHPMAYILISIGEYTDMSDPVEIVTLDPMNVYKWYVSEILQEDDISDFLARHNLSELDYNNNSVIRAIRNEMNENEEFSFVERRLD